MMKKSMPPYMPLKREDLYTLEAYSQIRVDFRAQIMQHKANRKWSIGPNLMLYFEDRLTMQYQVQEMLRVEKIFESAGIIEELESYNPLIPDGSNLKATMMLQYTDVEERALALERLIGIEDKVWLRVEGHEQIYPVCDEDLVDREREAKTSAVHFQRFEFSDVMIADLKQGTPMAAGVEHSEYRVTVNPVAFNISNALSQDFK